MGRRRGRSHRRVGGVLVLALALTVTGVLVGCGEEEDPGVADGSGSTFARQAFDAWCTETELCEYRGVGSGQGIEEVVDQTTDFGASDVPMTAAEVTAFGEAAGEVAPPGSLPLQLPVLIGAITVVTDVGGVDYEEGRLRFTGPTLAAIFSGEITRWDHPRILADNPGRALPDVPITRCVRSDSSGTTGVFTGYLAAADPGFADAVGTSRLPEWPGEDVHASEGNAGVAACVADRDDSIGYVDLADATVRFADGAPPERVGRLAIIGVERGGSVEWIAPTAESVARAGDVRVAPDAPLTSFGARILDGSAPGAYPIAATTYAILHDTYSRSETCGAVTDLVRWAYSPRGRASLVASYYAPVGPAVRERALAELARVRAEDGGPCAGAGE